MTGLQGDSQNQQQQHPAQAQQMDKNSSPQPHQMKINLQKLMHSANVAKRELSGMRSSQDGESMRFASGAGHMMANHGAMASTSAFEDRQQQHVLGQTNMTGSHQTEQLHQNLLFSQQQPNNNNIQWSSTIVDNSCDPEAIEPMQATPQMVPVVMDRSQQQQYAYSQNQILLFSQQNQGGFPAQGNPQHYLQHSQHAHRQDVQESLAQSQQSNPPTSPVQAHLSDKKPQPEFNAALLAAQITHGLPNPGPQQAALTLQQQQQLQHQQQQQQQQVRTSTMLMGYNSTNQDRGYSHTPMAELSQTHSALPNVALIEGVQPVGKRPSNFQLNKQLHQQQMSVNTTSAAGINKAPQRLMNENGIGNPSNTSKVNNTTAMNKQSSQSGVRTNNSTSLHRPSSSQFAGTNSGGQPPSQISANLNLMKQLYSAKGGVQTPPAHFKGSSSSVGSRRQSGESSGMISIGSIGTNCNEGIETVQKPLVREFKTQGRLNRGIMPAGNSVEEQPSMSSAHRKQQTTFQNLSRKSNAIVSNFTKKQSPKGSSAIAPMRTRQNLKRAQNAANANSKDTHSVTPINLSSVQVPERNGNNLTQIQSARLMNTKKVKSISESGAQGAALKSQKLKTMVKRPSPDSAAFLPNPDQQSIFDQSNGQATANLISKKAQEKLEHPEQPQPDISDPELTLKSQVEKVEINNEPVDNNQDVSNCSPNKLSFQQSSNQDAIERNEELMSLLASFNEQAIKELSTQDETEWETGMQRLLKAYKIMVETKNPNSFDANYKAIICYNLACCCQMQSELQDCSKYLTKAIEFVSEKLVGLKESAVSQFNQSQSQQMCNTTLEQPSLTITNSSITSTTLKKNSDLFERKQGRFDSNTKDNASKGKIVPTSGKSGNQAHLQGLRGQGNRLGGKSINTGGQQSSRNMNQGVTRTTAQAKGMKSPTGANEKQGRTTGNASKPNQANQNSLFSEFSRFANANQRQKVSQSSLRTISAANTNQVKARGIGGTSSTKNAQSQAQFSKATGSNLFNSGVGSTPSTRGQKSGQQLSEQKKRDIRSNYNSSIVTNGQPQTVQVDQANFFSQGKNIRDGQKKASKVQIKLINWLDCFSSTKSRPPREILERSIHLTRYYCRFVLQLCAVLSQLNEHEQALSFSKKASGLATELTEMTQILVKDEIKPQKASNQDTSGFGDNTSQKPKRRKHSTSNQLDPYNTTSLSKQKTTVSARFNNNAGTKGGQSSQNSSLVQSNLNQFSKEKVSQSYTMSNFNQLGAGREQHSSTQLNNSGLALSYFPNPEQIKNERESLERIHTFSLKEPMDLNASDEHTGAQTLIGNFLDPLFGSQTERQPRNGNNDNDKHNLSMETPFSGTRQRGISEGSRNSSTTSNRSCSHYVPDRVKIFQKQINNTHNIVQELISIQKEFGQISELNFRDRRDFFQDRMAEKKKLKISFQTFEEMNKLQVEQKFKITARSALGVKNYGTDDWIFSFNIGNIMHLQTLGFDELANAKTTQSMMNREKHDGNATSGLLRNGIQGSVTTQQGIRNYLMSEISKDQLLYKALYVIVSYFCIGTELRFLATLSPQKFSLKDSEIWHAKAIHIASYFLPNDCPLIQHIAQSYAKHHLRPKIKRRQDQIASLANHT